MPRPRRARPLYAAPCATEPAPASRNRERDLPARLKLGMLLRLAGGVGQRGELPGVELASFGFEPAAHEVRERQIDVVSAEEDVIADREPGEGKPPLLFAHADEREVARSAADVDDEDDVAGMDELAPRVARRLHPGVERGLRLFEESEAP